MMLNWIATSSFGMESVVKNELLHMDIPDVKAEDGRVFFKAEPFDAIRAMINLRAADRVLFNAGSFVAKTFDELFEGTKALPWENWLPQDACFPVNAKSVNSQLFSLSDCQAIVKKAIVERLKLKYNVNWFEETGAKYTIEIGLLKDVATLTIDPCGSGLHKRGYRKLTGNAPIRESKAAALVLLSRWHPDRPFLDPMCGTGTLPVEAALIGRNIAPGMNRDFDGMRWTWLPQQDWSRALEQAHDLIVQRPLNIMGCDIDENALSMARYHAKQAGVGDIKFELRDVAKTASEEEYGFILCNPPYGQRLGETDDFCQALYKSMGAAFAQMPTWGKFILCGYPNFEQYYGEQAKRRRKLYNGRIQCQFYQYPGQRPPWLAQRRMERE